MKIITNQLTITNGYYDHGPFKESPLNELQHVGPIATGRHYPGHLQEFPGEQSTSRRAPEPSCRGVRWRSLTNESKSKKSSTK